MTKETFDKGQDWLKNNLATYLTLGNMIILIGISYGRGTFEEQMQQNIKRNTELIKESKEEYRGHAKDAVMHRGIDELNEKFVPRKELETKLEYIMQAQDEIKELIKKQ